MSLAKIVLSIFSFLAIAAIPIAAHATEYIARVEEGNQKDKPYEVRCVEAKGICSMSLDISLKDKTLGILFLIKENYVNTVFLYNGQKLSTAQQGWDSFDDFYAYMQHARDVKLYIPDRSILTDSRDMAVLRPGNTFLTDVRIMIGKIP